MSLGDCIAPLLTTKKPSQLGPVHVLTQSSEFLMCCLALAISAARLLLGWRFFEAAEDELE